MSYAESFAMIGRYGVGQGYNNEYRGNQGYTGGQGQSQGGQRIGRGRGRGGGRGRGRGRGSGGEGSSRKYNTRKIFVGGVSKRDTNDESFAKFFQSFGNVDDIILMKAQDSYGGHRGFGFVTYTEQAVTDSVLAQAGQLTLDGRQVDVKIALPPELNPPEGGEPNKLFVGSLPKENFTTEDLRKYFSQWGSLTDAFVSQGRGFGFVTYLDSNGACKALLHGLSVGHSVVEGMWMDVKWATPKPRQGGRGRGGYEPQPIAGFGGRGAYGGNTGGLQNNTGSYAPSGYASRGYTSRDGYQESSYAPAQPVTGGMYQGSVGERYQPY